MIDWHSHVLPRVDDGSRSVSESLQMLTLLGGQGVDTVIATPHFYADDCSLDEFIEKRAAAYEALAQHLSEKMPRILLGAEVKYYPGISRMTGLERLAIENTSLLLLEMPISKWTEYTVRELIEISSSRGITVILAHMERYFLMQGAETQRRILESGVLMQANSSFFTSFGNRRRAMSLLDGGLIQFVGSDCHNLKSRPPRISGAYDLIRKRLGDSFVIQMNEYGYSALGLK